MLSFTIGATSIALFFNGVFYSIDDSHINYAPLREELKKAPDERDLDMISEYITVKKALIRLTAGLVEVTDEGILYAGKLVENYMTQRMMDLLLDGFDIAPWARFMDNVMLNPAEYARDELYEWMEKAKMPVTPDGCFLAFKKVRANYTDCHTGRFNHSPGTIVEMDRAECDTDRSNHCSTGFHFCSASYLASFGGQRVVVVKVNPKDVTSIPDDYSFTKGRTCCYEVVAELTRESDAYNSCWRTGLVNLENPAEFPVSILSNIQIPAPALNEPAHVTEAYEEAQETVQVPYQSPYDSSAKKEVFGIPVAMLTDEEIEDIVKDSPHAAQMRDSLYADRAAARIEEDMTDAGKADREQKRPLSETLSAGEVIANEIKAKPLVANPDVEAATKRLAEANETAALLFETSDNRRFTQREIEEALEEASAIRAAARALGIGESTLRGWKKKIEATYS